jgi:hypothetical protein
MKFPFSGLYFSSFFKLLIFDETWPNCSNIRVFRPVKHSYAVYRLLNSKSGIKTLLYYFLSPTAWEYLSTSDAVFFICSVVEDMPKNLLVKTRRNYMIPIRYAWITFSMVQIAQTLQIHDLIAGWRIVDTIKFNKGYLFPVCYSGVTRPWSSPVGASWLIMLFNR